jgi:sulfur carrier protein
MIVSVNGEPRELSDPTTLAGLIDGLGVPSRGVAVALDGEVVPRTRWNETQLGDGDRLEIVVAVQGG